MIENSLWVEKYRPSTLEEYVTDENYRKILQNSLDNGEILSALLYGQPGTGKTTLAKIIAKNSDCEWLLINASKENGIDVVRNKITSFISTVGFHKWKLVIVDEADGTTQEFQKSLRGIIEEFSHHARFILTCNYPEQIIPAIKSRCTPQEIIPPTKMSMALRAAYILDEEKIKYDPTNVATIVDKNYPDMRAVIEQLQKYSTTGELVINSVLEKENYMKDILDNLISNEKPNVIYSNIRQIIVDNRVRNFDRIYTYLDKNVDRFAPKMANIILLLAESQYKMAFAIDKEIQFMALCIQIIQELKN